ncbi:UNVERIFIED_CONTAM: hypothetical protein FKN15_032088 [Acipenser sinensis]
MPACFAGEEGDVTRPSVLTPPLCFLCGSPRCDINFLSGIRGVYHEMTMRSL